MHQSGEANDARGDDSIHEPWVAALLLRAAQRARLPRS
jgi:hypothetical protein